MRGSEMFVVLVVSQARGGRTTEERGGGTPSQTDEFEESQGRG